MASTLRGTDQPPVERYDVALLDLDGVVYVGPDAVSGAPDALAAARERGMQLAFVTNNAARPPEAVASHLTELGIAARPDEVITSAQAAARYLAEQLPAAAEVLVLGTTGLYEALREQNLVPTDTAGPRTAAVVQGYSPTMNWSLLAEGTVAVRAGALWVATNADPTVPSPRGPLPGNGAMVAALRAATNSEPVITGKPDPTMHRETVIRTGAREPIVVGDRLDTDIEGANAVGCASVLVLSGVTTATDLLAAGARLRPTFLGADVATLLDAHPQPELVDSGARCGGWSARFGDGALRLDGPGDEASGTSSDELDALRALCAAQWEHGGGSAPKLTAGDPRAQRELDRFGLAG